MTRAALRLLLGCWLSCCFGVACSAPEPPQLARKHATLTLLHLSDLHSRVFATTERTSAFDARHGLGVTGEWTSVGGFARLATLLRAERSVDPQALLFDSGDAVEGTRVYERFGGEPELLGLSALGVAAQALGNHDLSAGVAAAANRYARYARFPVLAANAEQPPSWLAEMALLEAHGLRIAAVGVAYPPSLSALEPGQVTTNFVGETARRVQHAIDRASERADLVVLLSHLGTDGDVALIERISGADVVLGGHDHSLLDPPRVVLDCAEALQAARGCEPEPVLLVHSGAYGKYLGVLRLAVSATNGADARSRDYAVRAFEYRASPVTPDVPADPELEQLLAPYFIEDTADLGAIGYVPDLVERHAPNGGDSALGNWVATTLLDATGAELCAFNTTTLRTDLARGVLTEDSLAQALPFDDRPARIRLPNALFTQLFTRGARLARDGSCKSALQLAGGRWEVACSDASFSLVTLAGDCLAGGCNAAGAAVDFASTSYVMAGGSGWLPALPATLLERSVRDLLKQQLQATAPCGAPAGTSLALSCESASDCAAVNAKLECARPDADREGRCVAPGCVSEIAAWLARECATPMRSLAASCRAAPGEEALSLCSRLPCVDARVGAASDGRIQMRR